MHTSFLDEKRRVAVWNNNFLIFLYKIAFILVILSIHPFF